MAQTTCWPGGASTVSCRAGQEPLPQRCPERVQPLWTQLRGPDLQDIPGRQSGSISAAAEKDQDIDPRQQETKTRG